MMPQPSCDASITCSPNRLSPAFSAAPTRVTPPAIPPDTASARSLVEVATVRGGILRTGERYSTVKTPQNPADLNPER
jgi:hypothetical protein